MSKSAPGLLARAKSLLEGVKAPWAVTGPLSSPEYASHLPRAGEYRERAPGSQGVRAMVPAAETNRVYDIKYFTRDARRAHLPGGTIKYEYYDFSPAEKVEALEALETAPTPGKKWQRPFKPILEEDNNGYTM
ncbi:NUOA7 [Auxenochlorella protothecoides x Auxenochlorella symbiontica]